MRKIEQEIKKNDYKNVYIIKNIKNLNLIILRV